MRSSRIIDGVGSMIGVGYQHSESYFNNYSQQMRGRNHEWSQPEILKKNLAS